VSARGSSESDGERGVGLVVRHEGVVVRHTGSGRFAMGALGGRAVTDDCS